MLEEKKTQCKFKRKGGGEQNYEKKTTRCKVKRKGGEKEADETRAETTAGAKQAKTT